LLPLRSVLWGVVIRYFVRLAVWVVWLSGDTYMPPVAWFLPRPSPGTGAFPFVPRTRTCVVYIRCGFTGAFMPLRSRCVVFLPFFLGRDAVHYPAVRYACPSPFPCRTGLTHSPRWYYLAAGAWFNIPFVLAMWFRSGWFLRRAHYYVLRIRLPTRICYYPT